MNWVGTKSKGHLSARAIGQIAIVLGALLIALAAPALASAKTDSVTTGQDNGQPGSLRYEIDHASDGDVVVIEPGVDPTLTGGSITIAPNNLNQLNNVTIQGQGPRATTIKGDGTNSLFVLGTNGTVSIAGVTMTQGGGGGGLGGGAIYVSAGSLSVTDSVLTKNSASCTSCYDRGGAIYFGGSRLTLERVTMTANSTDGDGGAVYQLAGVATIIDSTIVNNTATQGGGVFVDAGASATLTGDTVAHDVPPVAGISTATRVISRQWWPCRTRS